MDCKDAVIKSLMRDIEESEGQYHRALQGHLDSVNGLIEFQQRRLQEREEAFQEEVGELQLKFDQERYVRMYICVAQHLSIYIRISIHESEENKMMLILLTVSSESHDLGHLFLLGGHFVCSLLIEFILGCPHLVLVVVPCVCS